MSNIYRKLDRTKPSPTIIANGGGGTWGYHYEEPRPLTNRERARLQTFPDTFVFKGPIGEVRKQIGNAVPPLGIIPVAFQIKKYLIENYDISTDPYYKNYLKIINRIPKK
jgi:DNA (cytosine-5)-methyltransferase 1